MPWEVLICYTNHGPFLRSSAKVIPKGQLGLTLAFCFAILVIMGEGK
jgi:hypothetical protein